MDGNGKLPAMPAAELLIPDGTITLKWYNQPNGRTEFKMEGATRGSNMPIQQMKSVILAYMAALADQEFVAFVKQAQAIQAASMGN